MCRIAGFWMIFFFPFQNFKVLFIEHVKLYISLLLSIPLVCGYFIKSLFLKIRFFFIYFPANTADSVQACLVGCCYLTP